MPGRPCWGHSCRGRGLWESGVRPPRWRPAHPGADMGWPRAGGSLREERQQPGLSAAGHPVDRVILGPEGPTAPWATRCPRLAVCRAGQGRRAWFSGGHSASRCHRLEAQLSLGLPRVPSRGLRGRPLHAVPLASPCSPPPVLALPAHGRCLLTPRSHRPPRPRPRRAPLPAPGRQAPAASLVAPGLLQGPGDAPGAPAPWRPRPAGASRPSPGPRPGALAPTPSGASGHAGPRLGRLGLATSRGRSLCPRPRPAGQGGPGTCVPNAPGAWALLAHGPHIRTLLCSAAGRSHVPAPPRGAVLTQRPLQAHRPDRLLRNSPAKGPPRGEGAVPPEDGSTPLQRPRR